MMGQWATVVTSRVAMRKWGISAGTQAMSNTLAIRIPSLGCILATDIACLNREENVLLTSKIHARFRRTTNCVFIWLIVR